MGCVAIPEQDGVQLLDAVSTALLVLPSCGGRIDRFPFGLFAAITSSGIFSVVLVLFVVSSVVSVVVSFCDVLLAAGEVSEGAKAGDLELSSSEVSRG